MKKRVGINGGVPSDLLVCFPSRTPLKLMPPKPICSSPSKKPSPQNHYSLKHTSSSLFKTNYTRPNCNKIQFGSESVSEPTSPKVTCAGQIKVCHKKRNMSRHDSKDWIEALGLKKDFMNFLGSLRSTFRFNMQCFGSLHGTDDYSSGDDEEGECVDPQNINEEEEEEKETNGKDTFSKWFMMLDHNQKQEVEDEEHEEENKDAMLPPKNALLLMRCQSAPSKMKEEEKGIERNDEERLMLMSYAPDFFKLSTEIAKETWVVGGVDPLLARSRSWRR